MKSHLNTSPIKYLVLTHHHYDHVLGINEMYLLTIAHEKITEEINKMKSYKWDDLSLLNNEMIEDLWLKIEKEETFY